MKNIYNFAFNKFEFVMYTISPCKKCEDKIFCMYTSEERQHQSSDISMIDLGMHRYSIDVPWSRSQC